MTCSILDWWDKGKAQIKTRTREYSKQRAKQTHRPPTQATLRQEHKRGQNRWVTIKKIEKELEDMEKEQPEGEIICSREQEYQLSEKNKKEINNGARKCIHKIERETRQITENINEIINEVIKFYEKLYTSDPNHTVNNLNIERKLNRIPQEEKDKIGRPHI